MVGWGLIGWCMWERTTKRKSCCRGMRSVRAGLDVVGRQYDRREESPLVICGATIRVEAFVRDKGSCCIWLTVCGRC